LAIHSSNSSSSRWRDARAAPQRAWVGRHLANRSEMRVSGSDSYALLFLLSKFRCSAGSVSQRTLMLRYSCVWTPMTWWYYRTRRKLFWAQPLQNAAVVYLFISFNAKSSRSLGRSVIIPIYNTASEIWGPSKNWRPRNIKFLANYYNIIITSCNYYKLHYHNDVFGTGAHLISLIDDVTASYQLVLKRKWITVGIICMPPINPMINYVHKTTLGRRQLDAQSQWDFTYLPTCRSAFLFVRVYIYIYPAVRVCHFVQLYCAVSYFSLICKQLFITVNGN